MSTTSRKSRCCNQLHNTNVDITFTAASEDQINMPALLGKFDQALERLSCISENVSKILDFLLKLPDNQIQSNAMAEADISQI